MLIDYINAALHKAKYEILQEDQLFYGHVEELPGVYASAPTLEECREQLESVIEAWLLLKISLHHPVPQIDGHTVEVKKTA